MNYPNPLVFAAGLIGLGTDSDLIAQISSRSFSYVSQSCIVQASSQSYVTNPSCIILGQVAVNTTPDVRLLV